MYDFGLSKTIYSALSDEKSRYIYEKRCMLSLTDDLQYEDDIIFSVIDKKRIEKLISCAREVSDKLVIRGTGNEFKTLIRLYPDLEWDVFVDRDPMRIKEGVFYEHKVVSVDDFYSRYSDYYVLVCSSAFASDIVDELHEHGIDDKHIFNFGGLWKTKKQYFDSDIIKPINHEVFVDGGCYDGTTVRNFISWCGGNYDKIYSYEPDSINYKHTVELMEAEPVSNLTLYNKGLWDKSETLYFNESGGQGSNIVNEDSLSSESHEEDKGIEVQQVSSIEATTIDESTNGDAVTFIKLDVEGAEYEALVGAEKTIKKYHPRMAISIYHKPEDIFTLPELVMSMSDDYKFYLRHYQISRCETILYAIASI